MKTSTKKSNARRLGNMFNLLGHIYNPLKRVFLANQPEKVINQAVASMDFYSSVLVIGGGADNTLIELLAQNKCDNITHIDISSVQTQKGKDKLQSENKEWFKKVAFKTIPFLDFHTNLKFEAIVCPFYLDLFTEWEVRENIEKIKTHLSKDGLVYVIDFSSRASTSKQNILLIKILYSLFYPITGVYRTKVPNYKDLFKEKGFELFAEQVLYNGRFQVLAFKIA